MKKIIAIVLAIITIVGCVFAFTGCNKDGKKTIYIGVQAGTTGEAFVEGDEEIGFAGIPNAKASSYDTIGLAVNEIKSGNIQYAVCDKETALNLVAANPNDIKVIDIDLTVEQYAIGIGKNSTALKDDINGILAELLEDGTIAAIYAAYANIVLSDDEITASTPDSDIYVGINQGNKNASNKLVVATNAEYPPYEYKVGNKFYGIDMEIAKIIATRLGKELIISDMNFESVVTAVQKGDADIALACLTVTPVREKSVNFSTPYKAGASQVLIVKKSDTDFDACKTVDDIMAVFKSLK